MLIKYDRIVLEQARSIAHQPGATQRDLCKFLRDEDRLHWCENGGPYISYLAPEAIEEIRELYLNLPRRKK